VVQAKVRNLFVALVPAALLELIPHYGGFAAMQSDHWDSAVCWQSHRCPLVELLRVFPAAYVYDEFVVLEDVGKVVEGHIELSAYTLVAAVPAVDEDWDL
jgi:hypothetical protein